MEQQQHEMYLEKTHLSGAEEWRCPVCGRRMLINWKPKFSKIVLEVGDNYAVHSGGKGGLRIGSIQARPVDVLDMEGESQSGIDDFRLEPWIQWLDAIDFDNLWNNES